MGHGNRLVLIAESGNAVLTTELVERVVQAIEARGGKASKSDFTIDWLAKGHACAVDWFSDATDTSEARDIALACEKAKGAEPVDIAIVRNGRKKLLVADMESTIIEQECLDELAEYVGLRPEIAAITERAMRGELDFEKALRERVGLLKGLDARVLDEVYEKRVTLMPGAEALVRTMKANGAFTALVSGGFTFFTEKIAARLGFDAHQANTLEIADEKLTGRVLSPILGREAKFAALQSFTRKLNLDPAETLAVGDGANDLDMLAAAGLGVAFRAKPKVQATVASRPNGAVINHGDLTALLYLQGYADSEFAGS